MSPTRDVGGQYGLTCEEATEDVIATNQYMQNPNRQLGGTTGQQCDISSHIGETAKQPPPFEATSL